jgi:hypothetical protein
MKIQILLFFLLVNFGANCQELIIDENVILKKGIYQNFDEFKHNSPSIPFNYEIISTTKGYGPLNILKHKVYRLNLTRNNAKSIDKIFGFCDGAHVFVNIERPNLKINTDFDSIQFLGLYCYFEYIDNVSFPVPGPAIETITYLSKKAIDINKETIFTLTDKTLKEILENDKKLLFMYAEEGNYDDKIKDYLIMYSKKHLKDQVSREEPLNNKTANVVILKKDNDSTDQLYYNRVYNRLKKDPSIIETKLEKKFYNTGKTKSIGIIVRHNFDGNDQYLYKIGTWRYYYENGNLQEEIIYDINANKLSRKKFDEEGKIIE